MELNRKDLATLLPHRPPILMLETVVDVVPRRSGTGIRKFNPDDSFFQGHFPNLPILPGVLVIEAFAQTAMAVFLAENVGSGAAPKLGLLAKVNEMTFSEKIVPGLTVRFSITVDRHVGPFAFVSCQASGNDARFAFGKLTLKIGE